MATLIVQPRETPGERAESPVRVEVDEGLLVAAAELEEWAAPLAHWELSYRQRHDFDRPNNVEARLLFTGSHHTCSLSSSLTSSTRSRRSPELWLTLEERDGLAKAVHLAPAGLDVELGSPLGGTAS